MVSHYDERFEYLVDRLRRARVEAKLSQSDVAEKVGLSQPLVSRIEAGQRKIDPIELAMFCRLYRKPVRYFVPDMPV
jgi:transcriptional regulator with XRE-family HTH domain